jgi:hypothetical protein
MLGRLMYPAMTGRETNAFESFACASRRFLEFGSGGSTVLAAKHVADRIISIDSSNEWLEKVRAEVNEGPEIVLKAIDIGSVGEWGYPSDQSSKERWPDYSREPWVDPRCVESDLFLIDGRFRISCFCETLARASIGSIILIHDFDRPHYQILNGLARQIARAERLSAFIKDGNSRVETARKLADDYRLDPT